MSGLIKYVNQEGIWNLLFIKDFVWILLKFKWAKYCLIYSFVRIWYLMGIDFMFVFLSNGIYLYISKWRQSIDHKAD